MSDELPHLNGLPPFDGPSGDTNDIPPTPGVQSVSSVEAVRGSDSTLFLSSLSEPSSSVAAFLDVRSIADPTTDRANHSYAHAQYEMNSSQVVSSSTLLDRSSFQPVGYINDPVTVDSTLSSLIPSTSLTSIAQNIVSSANSPVALSSSCISSHPADPEVRSSISYDPEVMTAILALGFDEWIAILALNRTNGVGGAEAAVNWILEHSNESDFESDVEEGSEMGGSHSTVASVPRSQKMVFIVNTSLKMGVGKLAAQVGHATLGVYRQAQKTEEGKIALNYWKSFGEIKVVVKGNSTEQLLDLFKKAKDTGLFAYIVSDAGRTQIAAGSITVVGVFGESAAINTVTGELKLL